MRLRLSTSKPQANLDNLLLATVLGPRQQDNKEMETSILCTHLSALSEKESSTRVVLTVLRPIVKTHVCLNDVLIFYVYELWHPLERLRLHDDALQAMLLI